MELPSKYAPAEIEDKIYASWIESKVFKSQPNDKPAYTIVIPPPNVTGVLHMGHMLNNTIQDLLIRRARMRGFNACWVPGTDHASIATEAKVVQKLRKEGIKKSDLSRDAFLEHAWEWTHKHGGIILEQLKKLGASCDWDRTRFTMDEKYYESVIDCFIDLFKKGKIYRGERMINWDPSALTALSDEEVIYKEVQSKLYYVKYQIEGTNDYLTIATTRPETILGDTAVCVNPKDERYYQFHGKNVIVPIVNRAVPVIADEYVDMEFGTGCLKVTPAHDANDFLLGEKFKLQVINMMNADGTISEAGGMYVGEDRFVVREKIAEELNATGLLLKTEEHPNKVGYSERTDVVIEPRLSLQWFVDMKDLSKPALENVMNDNIRFFPPKFKNSYRNWMENIKDWCISRQLWWGHRIPAFYAPDGTFVVAKNTEDALAQFHSLGRELNASEIHQDEDVLDTWFSSWLWPISVFDGFYSKDELNYYYPTTDLVTAPEIMFFWVARMIVAGYEYEGKLPFKNVYYTGIVRDKLGRKMSKSLGNSPDPIELMQQYGADGVRVGMLLSSPAGNDLPFDESLCEQGRNFANKIWNAFRLVKSWEEKLDNTISQPESSAIAIKWMRNRMKQVFSEMEDGYEKFRISEVLMQTYKLIWDDFCSWYLEMVKPSYGNGIDQKTLNESLDIFKNILKILHPFMPFLTEEMWQHVPEWKKESEFICISNWPSNEKFDIEIQKSFEHFETLVTEVRNVRKKQNLPNKEALSVSYMTGKERNTQFDTAWKHLCNIADLSETTEKLNPSFGFMVDGVEYFVPYSASVDLESERAKMQEELKYLEGFLNSVEKKLSNERFVQNAPAAVLESEKKKQNDALAKIAILKEKLSN
jgi:valyl-tRNA synthetase